MGSTTLDCWSGSRPLKTGNSVFTALYQFASCWRHFRILFSSSFVDPGPASSLASKGNAIGRTSVSIINKSTNFVKIFISRHLVAGGKTFERYISLCKSLKPNGTQVSRSNMSDVIWRRKRVHSGDILSKIMQHHQSRRRVAAGGFSVEWVQVATSPIPPWRCALMCFAWKSARLNHVFHGTGDEVFDGELGTQLINNSADCASGRWAVSISKSKRSYVHCWLCMIQVRTAIYSLTLVLR